MSTLLALWLWLGTPQAGIIVSEGPRAEIKEKFAR